MANGDTISGAATAPASHFLGFHEGPPTSERKHILGWRDNLSEKPGVANKMLRTVKALLSFAAGLCLAWPSQDQCADCGHPGGRPRAMTGHLSAAMEREYERDADQARMSRDSVVKWTERRSRTVCHPP